MADFQLPDCTVHLGGAPRGKHMDVWLIPANGEDVLIITEWENGSIESYWGSVDSVGFHRSVGLADADTPPSDRVIAIAQRRLPEAAQWEQLSR